MVTLVGGTSIDLSDHTSIALDDNAMATGGDVVTAGDGAIECVETTEERCAHRAGTKYVFLTNTGAIAQSTKLPSMLRLRMCACVVRLSSARYVIMNMNTIVFYIICLTNVGHLAVTCLSCLALRFCSLMRLVTYTNLRVHVV